MWHDKQARKQNKETRNQRSWKRQLVVVRLAEHEAGPYDDQVKKKAIASKFTQGKHNEIVSCKMEDFGRNSSLQAREDTSIARIYVVRFFYGRIQPGIRYLSHTKYKKHLKIFFNLDIGVVLLSWI